MSKEVTLGERVDAALWHPGALNADVETLCATALRFGVRAVCVNSGRVSVAAARLEDSTIKTVALVGFPLGAMDSDTKRYEAEAAVDNGAQEIEVVLHAGLIKEKNGAAMLRELRDVVEVLDERPCYAIIERTLVTPDELIQAFEWVSDTGVNGVGIGTGFWPGALPSPEEVRKWRELLGETFALKVSGTFGDAEAARALLDAGANRVGVAGVPAWLSSGSGR